MTTQHLLYAGWFLLGCIVGAVVVLVYAYHLGGDWEDS